VKLFIAIGLTALLAVSGFSALGVGSALTSTEAAAQQPKPKRFKRCMKRCTAKGKAHQACFVGCSARN
jgi:hypothetical protein